jgi:hypothetical protein
VCVIVGWLVGWLDVCFIRCCLVVVLYVAGYLVESCVAWYQVFALYVVGYLRDMFTGVVVCLCL